MIERLAPSIRHNLRVFAHAILESLKHAPCTAVEEAVTGHTEPCTAVAELCRLGMLDLQQYVTGMFEPGSTATTALDPDTSTPAKN